MPCSGKPSTQTAREREVFRYRAPEGLPDTSAKQSPTPRSSSDPILTAFAQLGALRLNAKRGLISLSTRDNEFVIAESSKTLSIQSDDDEHDRLWHGVSEMRCKGLGPDLVKLFFDAEAPQYAVFNDLSKLDMFKERKMVVEAPFGRFLACVPLRTPSSMVIGNYIVVDDKPRDGLSEEEIQFMKDMGATVMDHLEAGRLKRKQYRAERMVKAMGLFIEGKASLREWWLQAGHQAQNAAVTKRAQRNIPLEHLADIEFGVQDPVDQFTAKGLNGFHAQDSRPSMPRSLSSSSISQSVRGESKGDGRPVMPQMDSVFSSSDTTVVSQSWHDRTSSVTTLDAPTVDPDDKYHSGAFDLTPDNVSTDTSKELQEVLFSSDIKGVFSRASNLIREAIAVDGVIFFDASIGSFGGSSVKDVMEETPPGAFDAEKLLTTSEDDHTRRSSETDGDAAKKASGHHHSAKPSEKCCNVLGFSTRRRSSLRGHAAYDDHHQFPEDMLRRLLKRYPHGKVFNFEEDGSFSSSDSELTGASGYLESDPRKRASSEKKAQRKRPSREAEAEAILTVLPKARSVFWFPLWDQNKERWFSGSLVWSMCPTRTLCPVEDLTYLAAFGNSVMAEVSRISAQALSQMKTDFISSISHELRSPLHGVLASVEFLQETALTEAQADMINNINASGKVLLDTINHVLDFSKINRKSKNKEVPPAFKPKRSRKTQSNQERGNLDNTADDIADVCILSEEVVESVYAGRSITKRAFDASYRQKGERPLSIGPPESPVTVIMDIGYYPSWKFEIDCGAWRRILMNLFSNALKYTETGFVNVSLHVEDDVLSRGKKSRSILTLKVKDSGKGISQEFLKHRLFKPFSQEDSLATGAGLGLSIVRHIVHDLGGEINFVSEQGVGTEATVRIPLTRILPSKTPADLDALAETRQRTKGLKFSLDGFDRYPDISETPTGILSSESETCMLLKSSIHSLMSGWFGMDAAISSVEKRSAAVVIIMESGFGGKSVDEILQTYNGRPSKETAKSIAIILSSAYPTSKTTSYGRFKVFYLPQPYGPHKIATMMHGAFSGHMAKLSKPETFTSHQIKPLVIPIDLQSTKPILPVFSAQTTPQRHSDSPQPRVENGFSPAVVATTELRQVPEAKAKISDPPSRDTKVSGDPKVEDSEDLRVLLVEDNEINLKLLVAYMRKLKLEHATACNGLEAFNAYKDAHSEAHKFDVIFMDISMPVMSGIESTQHIRRFERENGLQPAALIALTGAANPNTRQEAFSSGVDLFLTKPVPMKSLKVMLDDLKVHGRQGVTP